eukprot:scaffold2191_cov138-Isochrysis_galbana.AAC.2
MGVERVKAQTVTHHQNQKLYSHNAQRPHRCRTGPNTHRQNKLIARGTYTRTQELLPLWRSSSEF